MKKGYDPLREFNPQHRQQEVYSFTKQLCRNRSREAVGSVRQLGTADPNQSNTSLDRWFDQQYRPMLRRTHNPPVTNVTIGVKQPITPTANEPERLKSEKYFVTPSQFRPSVKKAVFSERNSNLFSQSQTEVQWKTTVKPILLKESQNLDEQRRPHVKKTDQTRRYTDYKRDPIHCENIDPPAKQVKQRKSERNPITDGEPRELLQRKMRGPHRTTIQLG